jgi:hypothetical protein
MVVRGKTGKKILNPVPSIERKTSLKRLGMTFNENLCNWDEQLDTLIHKVSSHLMYIL